MKTSEKELGTQNACYKTGSWDCPNGPVVKILPSNAGGAGSIPGQGTKIPHALQPQKSKHKTAAILEQIQQRL